MPLTPIATPVDAHPALARMRRAGHLAYGVAVAALGIPILLAGSLGAVFQPVPRWMPLPHGLAYASGAALLAGGLALLARRATRLAALVLTVDFFVWLLLLNLPNTLAKPSVVGNWEGCGLNMAVVAGAWILLAQSSPPRATGAARALVGDRAVMLARRLYAAGLPLVGLAHFADAQGGTVYVPGWLPLPIGWVYLTGAGHVAAGLAILFGVLPGLASVLEAAQITAFVVLAHIPAVYAAPGDQSQWAMLLYAAAIAGSAWLVAATVGTAPRRHGP